MANLDIVKIEVDDDAVCNEVSDQIFEQAVETVVPGPSKTEPGTIKRRKVWDKQNMINAVEAVREGSCGLLAASIMFDVPKNTLHRYVKKRDIDPHDLVNSPLGRKRLASESLESLESLKEEISSETTQESSSKEIKRKSWDKQNMINAVQVVRDGAVGLLAASKMFNVPKITLRRYAKNVKAEPSAVVNTPLGRKPYSPEDLDAAAPNRKLTWDKQNMTKAVLCVRSGKLGYASAGKLFKVPYLTLRWYVKNAVIDLSTEKDIPVDKMPELVEMMKTKRVPSKRKLWNKQNMINAIKAVRDGAVGYLAASKIFGVPKVSLRRYAKMDFEEASDSINTSLGRKPVLTPELQDQLAEYCTEMDDRFFGMKGKDVLQVAYQLARKHNIANSFQNESAGRTWLHNFMKRYPDLYSRTLRAKYGSKSLTYENMKTFIDLYEPEYEKVNKLSHRIFSMDDISFCIADDQCEKVVRLKNMKYYSIFASTKEHKLATTMICMNASNHFVPPLIIWSSEDVSSEIKEKTPNGSISTFHLPGFVTSDIFLTWFDHFIKHTSPSANNPVLLLIDAQKPYTRSIEILGKARENHVHLVSLPPNSFKLQPLEVSFFECFPNNFNLEVTSYLNNVSAEDKMQNSEFMTLAKTSELFTSAYNKSTKEERVKNAFQKVGLWPLKPDFFLHPEASRAEIKEIPKGKFRKILQKPPETSPSTSANVSFTSFSQSYGLPVIENVYSVGRIKTE